MDARHKTEVAFHKGGEVVVEWYLIRTKPGKEREVRDRFRATLPEVFLPLLSASVHRWGKSVKSVVPLFPCYVFARFELDLEYVRVKYAAGVRELVHGGSHALAIPGNIITTLKDRCGDGPIELPMPPLRSGDCVRVTEGPFRGFDAVFERYLSGVDRVAILLSSLERLAPRVVLPMRALEPSAESAKVF